MEGRIELLRTSVGGELKPQTVHVHIDDILGPQQLHTWALERPSLWHNMATQTMQEQPLRWKTSHTTLLQAARQVSCGPKGSKYLQRLQVPI